MVYTSINETIMNCLLISQQLELSKGTHKIHYLLNTFNNISSLFCSNIIVWHNMGNV